MTLITVQSFGFNFRCPDPGSYDLLADVRRRFRNPFEDDALRELTGDHPKVVARVLGEPGAWQYIDGLFYIALALASNGRRPVVIMIGCAGGRHRSRVIANRLGEFLDDYSDHTVRVEHLDDGKPVTASSS